MPHKIKYILRVIFTNNIKDYKDFELNIIATLRQRQMFSPILCSLITELFL